MLGVLGNGIMRDACRISSNSIESCEPQSYYTFRASVINWLWGLQDSMELLEILHASRIIPFPSAPNIPEFLGMIWSTSDCCLQKHRKCGFFNCYNWAFKYLGHLETM